LNSHAARETCRIFGNLGDNHNGDPELAKQLVGIAISAGCDGVVLPHRRVASSYTREALLQPAPDGAHGTTTLGEILQAKELSSQAIKELRDMCTGSLDFIAAPHDLESFEDLQAVEPDAYQIEAPVLGHVPLLKAVASTGRPVFLVAGACTEDEIDAAAAFAGKDSVTLLHCVYAKGVDPASTALWCVPGLAERFQLPVGYFGLEQDIYTPVAAFALGARVIEKVFTSDKHLAGPSHATSLDRDELRAMVASLRGIEQAISGDAPRILLPAELESTQDFRPSLVAACDLSAGVTLDSSMLSVKIAPHGISPKLIEQIVGRRLVYDLQADTPITFAVVEA